MLFARATLYPPLKVIKLTSLAEIAGCPLQLCSDGYFYFNITYQGQTVYRTEVIDNTEK